MATTVNSATCRDLARRLVRRLSAWAWRDEHRLQQNVIQDAQALLDALNRGERVDAYCGYGRDGQASNYRDELKWSLRELNRLKKTERIHHTMTPLTHEQKLALLDRLQKLHQAASDRHDELRRFIHIGALEPYWHLADFGINQTAARIDCNGNDLAWHATLNEWGVLGKKLNGLWVCTNSDFLRAVERGES